MGKFKKKPDPSPKVFRRQIERSAAAYTDFKIDQVLSLLEDTDTDEIDSDGDDSGREDDENGRRPGGGGGIGVVFPPDIPTPWVIPRPPIRDISSVGTVQSVSFQNSSGDFEYDENSSYGELYLSSDGALSATVTIKVEGEGDIEDFEVQVTKIDQG